MSIHLLNRLEYLDFLISSKSTGSPKKLAARMKISERSLYDLILLMKAMGAPISYNRVKRTYFYSEEGAFNFRFTKSIKEFSDYILANSQKKLAAQIATLTLSILMQSG